MKPEVNNKTEAPAGEPFELPSGGALNENRSISEQAWSDISILKVAEVSPGDAGNELIFTPLDFGTVSDTNPIILAQAKLEGDGQANAKGDGEPPQKQEKSQERDLDAIRKKLEKAFLNDNGTEKSPAQIVDSIEKTTLPNIEDIPELDKLEIPEIQNYVEFEPDLWHRIKENPLITLLVTYGGYQVIKQGRKYALYRARKNAEAKGTVKPEKRADKPADKPANKQPEPRPVEERSRRRPRLLDSESATKFEKRVEAQRGESGTFEKSVSSGSKAVLGVERASESLTQSQVKTLKQELARLKASKVQADNRKAANLERVVTILENSKSPKVQAAAHKYIRNRIAEAERAQRRKGIKGKVGAVVAIGILVGAAIDYFNNRDQQPDLEEDERAGVSGQ